VKVWVDVRHVAAGIDPDRVRQAAEAALEISGNAGGELSVVIVGDEEIRDLNRRFLDRDRPTNVIAFPMLQGEFSTVNPGLLGDVVISAQTAAREAEQGRISVDRQVAFLLVHGLLHLLGYEHEEDAGERARMEEAERELLEALIERALA